MEQTEENDGILTQFQTYGWAPDDSLSDDNNMMDLVLLVTRSSKLKQGSMACILVSPPGASCEESLSDPPLLDRIISIANNQELYKPGSSDIHAEIAAIGVAARRGRSTNRATAYITMPPCKNCFGALLSAGIERIVSIHPPPTKYNDVLERLGVEMVGVENLSENRSRVDNLISAHNDSLTNE